jgi:hypothetical protein
LANDALSLEICALEYELEKLGTVFTAIEGEKSPVKKTLMVECLKEVFPAGEICEIVAEYFPQLYGPDQSSAAELNRHQP